MKAAGRKRPLRDHRFLQEDLQPSVPPAPQSAQPSMLKAPPSPGLNDSSFDANTEMADIDRRLNALQDFLKEAKNGNISVDAE